MVGRQRGADPRPATRAPDRNLRLVLRDPVAAPASPGPHPFVAEGRDLAAMRRLRGVIKGAPRGLGAGSTDLAGHGSGVEPDVPLSACWRTAALSQSVHSALLAPTRSVHSALKPCLSAWDRTPGRGGVGEGQMCFQRRSGSSRNRSPVNIMIAAARTPSGARFNLRPAPLPTRGRRKSRDSLRGRDSEGGGEGGGEERRARGNKKKERERER